MASIRVLLTLCAAASSLTVIPAAQAQVLPESLGRVRIEIPWGGPQIATEPHDATRMTAPLMRDDFGRGWDLDRGWIYIPGTDRCVRCGRWGSDSPMPRGQVPVFSGPFTLDRSR